MFVPADRPERFGKALRSGADVVVIDMEDSIDPSGKAVARDNVSRWLRADGAGLVRVNASGTSWHDRDVAEIANSACGPIGVVLPKASGSAQIAELLGRLPEGSFVLPLIETAAGVLDAREICSAQGVVRLAFGNGDLSAQLGVAHDDLAALAHARAQIVLASAAGGLPSPVDGVTTAIHDSGALIADTEHAAALGFTGKLCVHPKQIPVVHKVFAPSEADIRRARDVVASSRADAAATVLDGELVDKPVVDHARRILSIVENGR